MTPSMAVSSPSAPSTSERVAVATVSPPTVAEPNTAPGNV